MGDIFKEQLVKKEPSSKDKLMKAGIVLGAIVIFIVSTMFIPGFSFFVLAIAGFAAYWLITMLNQEFEYVFTNGELDIDRISNQSRRKRVFSGHVKEFEVMAHVEDKVHIGEFGSAAETWNFSSGGVKDNTYAALVTYKGKKIKLILEPNEKILQAITHVIPRKVFVKK